jgi:hypothetical protein
MKQKQIMAIGALLLLAASAASAQSLADYARAARKNKPEPSTASHHYDNDNLPSGGDISVVGEAPAQGADQSKASAAATTPGADAADHQKAADDLKEKLDTQKQKIDALSRDLDLEQREFRLRAAAFYGDAGERLRNSAQWDKDQAQYKSDIDSKQKAIDTARQELDNLQEQARKAGLREKEQPADKTGTSNNDETPKDKDNPQNKN